MVDQINPPLVVVQNTIKIRTAGLAKKTIDMTYKKMGRGTVAITVKDYKGLEPYEIRDGFLFAFDPAVNHIKRFAIRDDNPAEGIVFVKEGASAFEPRWPLKL